MTLDFDCKLTEAASHLTISYGVHNGSAHDVGVFNRIRAVSPDGTSSFDPDVAFIDIEGDVLLVRKMALPIPEGLSMTSYIPPRVSRIPPGQSLSESMTLRAPIKVMQPFRRAMLRGQAVADVPATAHVVQVTVGVFSCDGACALTADDPAFPDVWTAFPPSAALSRQQLFSRQFSLQRPVAVLDYRAVPWP